MGEWYGKKIINEVINPKTSKAWAMADVPKLWKAKTQKWLDEYVNNE
ncbi:MAG: hypothetical protein J6O61_03055 [Butyrivibrio sp.]|nr:hypothetical protein [Butyrivibrio sp.]MBO6239807.1 hypothetical protein [Butyrivibrio sp.]